MEKLRGTSKIKNKKSNIHKTPLTKNQQSLKIYDIQKDLTWL